MDQRIIDLYDSFTHGGISRREFLDRATGLVGSAAAAAALLPLLQNDYAKAETVPAERSAPGFGDRKLRLPAAAKSRATSSVRRKRENARRCWSIHENRGMNPHIKDVARRLALEGYLAFAVDLLSPLGGTPDDEEKGRELYTKINRADPTANVAAVAFLKKHRGIDRKSRRGRLLRRRRDGQPVRGRQPRVDAIGGLLRPRDAHGQGGRHQGAAVEHYAENDQGVNSTHAGLHEEALEKNNKKFTMHTYPGTQHAFNNDTGGATLQQGTGGHRLGPHHCLLQGKSRRAAESQLSAAVRNAKAARVPGGFHFALCAPVSARLPRRRGPCARSHR